MTRLKGKVALVTGSAGGIGSAVTELFESEGAAVIGADLYGDPAIDLADSKAVDRFVAEIDQIDIVIAAAGTATFGPITEVSDEDWRATLSSELDTTFVPIRAAWSKLEKNGGAIVTLGSTAGLTGSLSQDRTAHTAAKGAVIALTRQLAAEGAAHNIRANSISPGITATPQAEKQLSDPDHPMSQITNSIPLGRIGTRADVAKAALFLASEDSAYITASNLVVDGGWSSMLPGPWAAQPWASRP